MRRTAVRRGCSPLRRIAGCCSLFQTTFKSVYQLDPSRLVWKPLEFTPIFYMMHVYISIHARLPLLVLRVMHGTVLNSFFPSYVTACV